MLEWQSTELGILNKRTGEIFDAELRLRRHQTGGKWMKKFQNGAVMLLNRTELHGQSYHILHYLDSLVGWGNIIPSPFKVATILKKNQTNVYRAYAELIKAEFVIKKDRVYYLSPLYCWKGSTKGLELACRELLTSSIKVLNEGINPPAAGVLGREVL